MKKLFDKYDVAVPRYTSYPPVPDWKDNLSTESWLHSLQQDMQNDDFNWSLYLHMPFCESQCHFCACNNIITKNHDRESQYIEAIIKEWKLYSEAVPQFKQKKLRQLHLGGGTPSFFSASNLDLLFSLLFQDIKIDLNSFDASIEIDPRRYNLEQLKVLKKYNFNRISLGVQDFDYQVQKNVNRVQSFELIEKCVADIKNLGFDSINFDLIYGLPGQTEDSITETAKKVMQLQPDRIALYSLAVVPWLKPAHGSFEKFEIKKGFEKRKLYEAAKKVFLQNNYLALGMDHFAKPEDALTKSYFQNDLHRNFMGYTEYSTEVLLGLGLSSISESTTAFHQNQKNLNDYFHSLFELNKIPSMKAHLLSDQEKIIKEIILNLMTKQKSKVPNEILEKASFEDMLEENLLSIDLDYMQIQEQGIPFLRNICNRIDLGAQNNAKTSSNASPRFSSGV